MAAPNIVNVTSILGKTVYDADVATSQSATLTNAASSNKLLKINTIIAANIDGTNAGVYMNGLGDFLVRVDANNFIKV